MGLPARLKGVDAHGSSTVMVLEDVPPPGQVLTGMRHWASSRLALVRRVVGRGEGSGVGWDSGGEEPGNCVVGGHASDSWREELDVGGRTGGESIVVDDDDDDAGLESSSIAPRIDTSYRPH